MGDAGQNREYDYMATHEEIGRKNDIASPIMLHNEDEDYDAMIYGDDDIVLGGIVLGAHQKTKYEIKMHVILGSEDMDAKEAKILKRHIYLEKGPSDDRLDYHLENENDPRHAEFIVDMLKL